MAIAHDSTTATTSGGKDVSGITFPHTVGAGSDRYLKVGVAINQWGPATVSSITYAGVAMTRLGGSVLSGFIRVEYWYLLNPPTGTHDVVVTLSDSPMNLACAASSYFGVNQTTPHGTESTATGVGTAPSVSVQSAPGELVVDVMACADTGYVSVGSGQTLRGVADNGTTEAVCAVSDEAGATSVTMSHTIGAANDWAIIGVSLRPAAAGAAVTPGVAALVLAGSQAGLLRELLIRPGVGLLALSAHQAHVLRERLLAPGVAAPTFFGQQPAISMPAQAAVFAGTGALVILGLQPTLLYARAVQPATGVLTLTGLQPTLARERIVIAGIGELALVPRDVAEFLGRLVQPGSSALTFGGEQPALQLTEGLRLDPDAGAAALQGRAPTLLRELVVTPGVGAVVVVPLAPSLDLPFAWYDTSASASLVWSAALAGSATWTAARSAPPVAWS